jgi:hypothetical protein
MIGTGVFTTLGFQVEAEIEQYSPTAKTHK